MNIICIYDFKEDSNNLLKIEKIGLLKNYNKDTIVRTQDVYK